MLGHVPGVTLSGRIVIVAFMLTSDRRIFNYRERIKEEKVAEVVDHRGRHPCNPAQEAEILRFWKL